MPLRRLSRPNDVQLKRNQELRSQIRDACQAVLDSKTGGGGDRNDEEYQRILDLRQLLPR